VTLSIVDELNVLAGSFLEGLLRHGYVDAAEDFLEWWTAFKEENDLSEEDDDDA